MKYKFLELCAAFIAFAISASAAPPAILSPPQSQTNNAGSTATFTVIATNATGYQWQFGTTNINGATNSTLTLEDLTTNQAGAYTVIVNGPGGAPVSNNPPAILTVLQGTIVQFAITGYPGGGSNNLLVELFDHDKPATVQNFIHYMVVGSFTNNMFWSRCVPGFVLQGGDYIARDRTNGAPVEEHLLYEAYTANLNYSPPFPFQIDNQFNAGPLIHNTYGTLAMAKQAGAPDSAANAFFFNLGDNSTNLDNQDGGFTVFGRIVSGTNVLTYFNGLSKPTNGIYDSGLSPFTDMPVNLKGTEVPGDSNLFFVDITFLTQPTIDTTPPTVTLAYPTSGGLITNAELVVQGTASDDVGLARVICNFADSTGYYGGAFGGDAIGTTNWSYDAGNLAPGIYYVNVTSQDGAGNLSPNQGVLITIPRFPFEALANGPGALSTNLNGTNTTIGSTYAITAIPDTGASFVDWTSGNSAYLGPNISLVMMNGLQLAAHFISNAVPAIIAITNPAANAQLTNGTFNISGTVSSANPPVQVTWQIFSNTLQSIAPATTVTVTNSFSFGVTNLAAGNYIVQALAQDAQSNATVLTSSFTVLAAVTIVTNVDDFFTTNAPLYLAPGQQTNLTAAPVAGEVFYNWQNQGVVSINPVQTITANGNLTLIVSYVPTNLSPGLSITSFISGSTALAIESNLTVTGTLPSANITQLTCQFFLNSNYFSYPEAAVVNGSNWLLTVNDFTNGAYTVVALATDANNQSSLVSASFNLLNVDQVNLKTNGSGTVSGFPGQSYPGYLGQYAAAGAYTLTAAPGPGYVFYSWSDGVTTTLNPSNTINLKSNLNLTATFVSDDLSLKGIAFAYPPANAKLTKDAFNVEVMAPASLSVTQMTCQLFLQSNGVTALPQPATFDSTSKKWTLPVANLTPGRYLVLAEAYDSAGTARLVSESFNVLAKLAVEIEPPGTGAVTAGLNGRYIEVGTTNKITATAKAGQVFAFWTGAAIPGPYGMYDAASAFVMSSNTVLTAHFTTNPFPPVAGTYNGLFINWNEVTTTNAGSVTVTVNRSGVYSGKLVFPSHTVTLSSERLSYTGSNYFQAAGGLKCLLLLDLTNGGNQLSGYVSYPGAWTNEIYAYRAATALSSANVPEPGKYIITFQPTSGGAGNPTAPGYAAVTLEKNGTVLLAGVLPDNTPISRSVAISTQGYWPLFISPSSYRGYGMIIGLMTNMTSVGMAWLKPGVGGAYYPHGVATWVSATGASHLPPAADTKYEIVFSGANLGTNAGVTDFLSVNNAQRFVPDGDTNNLEISLLPSGVLSGHFFDGKTIQFKGAFTSQTNGGAGFFLDAADGESGSFEISIAP